MRLAYLIIFPIIWFSLLIGIAVCHFPAAILTPLTIPGWAAEGWLFGQMLSDRKRGPDA